MRDHNLGLRRPSRGAKLMQIEVEISDALAIDLMAHADGLNAARRQDLAVCLARVGLDDGELIADEANRKITLAS